MSYIFPGSQTIDAQQLAAMWQKIGAPANVAQAFGQGIAGAEGGNNTGAVYNTAFPSLPGYTPVLAGNQPEYSVGLYGLNIFGDLGVTDPQQAFQIGQKLAENPEYQTQVAAQMFSTRGFQPWEGDSFVKDAGGPQAALSNLGYSSPPQVSGGVQFSGNIPASSGATSQNPPTPAPQSSPAGNAPGSLPGGPNNIPQSPQMEPGTTSSLGGPQGNIPTLPGDATTQQAIAFIKQHYPTYAFILRDKGVQQVLTEAAKGGWSQTNIQAAIAQTPWWKTTSNALRNWQLNKATNPGDLDFNKKGSSAQQMLGHITDQAKSVGMKLGPGVAENLATEALMYGWDPTQVKENVGSVAASGVGEVYNPSYLSGMEANPRQYEIGGKGGTGPEAASAITAVRNAIAGQGYNAGDFTNEDVDNLAQEYMKFGWSQNPEQLAAAVIKVGAGGTAYQLDQSYTQGLLTNPEQYQFGNSKTGQKPGVTAQNALTTVRDAIAAAGKKVGGKGGISNQQVRELAQESMMFGWKPQQLAQNINDLGKGGGLLSSQYLSGLLTNAQEYQPGGNVYNQAVAAVQTALRDAGKSGIGKLAQDALVQQYMEQGWQESPQQLTDAIGRMKGSGAISAQYLTEMQANPQALQPGGTTYKAAQSAVEGATAGAGKMIDQAEVGRLVQQYLQQGWTQGAPGLTQAINAAKGQSGYSQQYVTQQFQNRQSDQPGGANYKAAQQSVSAAVKGAGMMSIKPSDETALVQQYLQQGWNESSPGLTQAIGGLKNTQGYSQAYTQGMQQNPAEYQPGGSQYVNAQNTVKGALQQAGVANMPQADQERLIQGVLQQGWQGQTLLDEVGYLAHTGTPYASSYTTGFAQNPTQYNFGWQPGQGGNPDQTTYEQQITSVQQMAAEQNIANLPMSTIEALARESLEYGWKPEDLSKHLGQVAKTGTYLSSQYLTGMQQDPTQYQFSQTGETTADQMLTQVEVIAGQQQVNLTRAQAEQIADQALKFNLPSQDIQRLLEPYINLNQGAPAPRTAEPANADAARAQGTGAELGGQPAQNTAPGLTQQLRTTAAQYLLSPTDPALQQWERQIAGGTQDMTQFQAYLAQQAADKYPGMAQLIQQGQTPAQITSNLQNLASSTLEINPDQVNFINNPQFQKLLDGGYNDGPNGTKVPNGGMMTYSQAGQYLRGLPQFQYTTNAHTDAGELNTEILQAFGRVA